MKEIVLLYLVCISVHCLAQKPELVVSIGHSDGITAVAFSPDGQYILTGSDDSTAKLWDRQGREIKSLKGHSNFVTSVAFSPDGQYILTGSLDHTAKLWDHEGREIKSLEGHSHYVTSVAFSPDGQFILTGSYDYTPKLWDREGREIKNLEGHSGGVSSVTFSPDGKFILTGSSDHTAKLWNHSGQEIASLVVIDSANWIIATPDGLFDASPGAMNLIHYSLFYQRDREYLVIELEQLKARYYEPGLLPKLLGLSDDPIRPVSNFNTVKLHPKVHAEIIGDSLHIELHARNGGIGKVSIFINGKEVTDEANPLPRGEDARRDSSIRFDLQSHQNYLLRHPDSTNTISIRAYNEEGWLKSPAVNLEYRMAAARSRGSNQSEGQSDWTGQLDPKLYVISIGTSNYAGIKLDLQYADQDATMMARALQSVGTALFTNGDSLEVHCLTTASPDSTGLEGTPIRWQSADKDHIESVFQSIRQKAKAEDVVVVYLSGHGVTQGGTDQTLFYYLTKNINGEDALSDPDILRAYAISSEELTKWLTDIPALKQVLIIDACHSGQIVENLTGGTKALNSSQIRAMDRMKDRTGMFVLSGSAADKVSYEAGEYGQGLLTYALLEGMRGVATRKDREGKETVDVMALFQHARDRVPELASTINGIQTPMLGFPSRAASFDIGLLDERIKDGIPIGNKKPVMIRSHFLNRTSFADNLGIADTLETAFRQESAEGSSSEFIFVDVYRYTKAFSLGGLYEQTDAGIAIEIKLLVNGNPVGKFYRDPAQRSRKSILFRPEGDPGTGLESILLFEDKKQLVLLVTSALKDTLPEMKK